MNKLAKYIEKHGAEKSASFLDRLFGRVKPTPAQIAELAKVTAGYAKMHAHQLNQSKAMPHMSPTVWNEFGSSLELANQRGPLLEEIGKLKSLADSKRSSLSDTYSGGQSSPLAHDIAAKKLLEQKTKLQGLGKDLSLEENFTQQALDGVSAAFDKHLGNPHVQEAKARFFNPITENDHRLRRQFERNYAQNILAGKPTEFLIKTPPGMADIREAVKLPYASNSRGAEFDVKGMLGKDLGSLGPTFNKKVDELLNNLRTLQKDPNAKRVDLQKAISDYGHAAAFKNSFSNIIQQNKGLAHGDLNDAANPRAMRRIRLLLANPLNENRLPPDEVKKAILNIRGILKANPNLKASDAFAQYMGHAAANPADSRILEVVKHRRMDSDEAKKIYETIKKTKSGPTDERWRKWTDAGAVGVLGAGAASVPYLYFKDEARDQ